MTASTELPTLPPRFTLAQAAEAGLSRHWLRGLIDQGDIRLVARNVYAVPVSHQDGDPWALVRADHLERARDWLARHPGHVASHHTAGIIHGLDLSLHPATPVHLTSVERCPRSRRREGVVLHHSDSVENEMVLVNGLRVTTLPRTIADLLRASTLPNGVALLDAALRAGDVSSSEVQKVVDSQLRWRGRPRARQALTLADPRRESWLESYSFVCFHERGMPMPTPQVEVLDEVFRFVGRVDGLIGTVFLEADGQGKYLAASRELGMSASDSIAATTRAERARHTALERLGLTGVRWTNEEIRHHADDVVARLRAALRASVPARFTGWLRQSGQVYRPVL